MRTLNEILENINEYEFKGTKPQKPEGYRIENYVYDEEKSVRWNREHREQLIKEYEEEYEKYRNNLNKSRNTLLNDIIIAIQNEFNFNEEQAEKIYSLAYEESHSEGINEVINKVKEISENIIEINSLK